MTDRSEMFDRLKGLIAPFNKKGVDVSETTTFAGDLEWDSLTVMDFVAEVEDSFDIIISISDIQCGDDFVHHAPSKRIQFVGPIQSDCGNAVRYVEENVLKIHTTTLAMQADMSVVRLDVEELAGGNSRTDAACGCTND